VKLQVCDFNSVLVSLWKDADPGGWPTFTFFVKVGTARSSPGSIASHPCKERKDGAPSVRLGEETTRATTDATIRGLGRL
jgi:hypothetical protein